MYSFVCYLLTPFTLLLLALAVGVVALWRKPRSPSRARWWVTICFLALVIDSLPPVGYLAVGSLEWQHPPLNERPSRVDAIVVLGGAVLTASNPRAELNSAAIRRCIHAASLYRQGEPCPVVTSAGKVDPSVPGPPCADLMGELLVQLGVRREDVVIENTSRTTYENAMEVGRILKERRLERVVLVTDAAHLPRAVLCFRRQGLDVVPSGCTYRTTEFELSGYTFLPTPDAIAGSEEASHEWLGIVAYWLTGKI